MNRKSYIILFLIFILGTFLRFYKLESLPSSYSPDELAQAYTAYSLLNTGKDEWGIPWPLSLRSFGDFKPPLQTYLMIPSIKLFGLTPFAARFPNALFSSLSIIAVFLFTKQLFKRTIAIPLLSALFLSLSPWHLPMSRLALEANLHVFFVSLGLFFFLRSTNSTKSCKNLIISAILLILASFSYHSTKALVPLVIILISVYKKRQATAQSPEGGEIFSNLKPYLVFYSVIFLFLTINFFNSNSTRTSDIVIFNPTDKWQSVSDQQFQTIQNGLPTQISRIFNNKFIYTTKIFFQNYFSYFSPQFLLTNGASETDYGMIPSFGVLNPLLFLGLLVSLTSIFSKKHNIYHSQLLFLLPLILLTPIPATLAKGQMFGNRASIMIPFIQIFSVTGLYLFYQKISQRQIKKATLILLASIFIFYNLDFLSTYFYRGNQILAHGMLYGHKEAIKYVQKEKPSQIIYSRKLSEPQAYASFFMKIAPKLTQQESINWLKYDEKGLSFLDQLGEYKLDNFIFRELTFAADSLEPDTILIGKPEEFPVSTKIDKIIYYPYATSQTPAIYIYKTSIAND
ncbi:glycosyltransferase family 39 protein [Patescibacteria group bacterium]|nr:glycosyltransferase family 39 protein [Patescibacteria group bacterium]MCG2702070.1 glycosyltransferase family 39 protein [Candidatus Parcubacteria bacterium]MBU4265146.1 glycosyltransferase family 39 protein [Patescibacteria group bacterium]MBU4390710.1 glycosyltransferase family 39 protein [Patescibacteria group bacterium]MBU4431118.1 glycosyltransferase family 39 protein [Patescibacteria group bacterium]